MLLSSVLRAIGDPVQAMQTLSNGLLDFKDISSSFPDVVIPFFTTFLDTERFEDLPESGSLQLKTLSTFDLNKYDGRMDLKNWLAALKTTALALIELQAGIASMRTRSIKVVSSRKELSRWLQAPW